MSSDMISLDGSWRQMSSNMTSLDGSRRRMSSNMTSLDGARRQMSSNMTSLDGAWRRRMSSSMVGLDDARPRQLGCLTKTKRTKMATIHHLPVEVSTWVSHWFPYLRPPEVVLFSRENLIFGVVKACEDVLTSASACPNCWELSFQRLCC